MKLKDVVQQLNEKRNLTIITIICTRSAADDCLLPLIDYIKTNGYSGHSFPIVVDDEKKFYFDGDGADYIKSIKVSTEDK